MTETQAGCAGPQREHGLGAQAATVSLPERLTLGVCSCRRDTHLEV